MRIHSSYFAGGFPGRHDTSPQASSGACASRGEDRLGSSGRIMARRWQRPQRSRRNGNDIYETLCLKRHNAAHEFLRSVQVQKDQVAGGTWPPRKRSLSSGHTGRAGPPLSSETVLKCAARAFPASLGAACRDGSLRSHKKKEAAGVTRPPLSQSFSAAMAGVVTSRSRCRARRPEPACC